jgi:hypothetical protein
MFTQLDLVGLHFDVNNTFIRRLYLQTAIWQQLHAIIVWTTFATIGFYVKSLKRGLNHEFDPSLRKHPI